MAAQAATAAGDNDLGDDDEDNEGAKALNIGVAAFFIAKRAAVKLVKFTNAYNNRKKIKDEQAADAIKKEKDKLKFEQNEDKKRALLRRSSTRKIVPPG